MTAPEKHILFLVCVIGALNASGALYVVCQIWNQQTTDNQIMAALREQNATLRAQLAETKHDLADTEQALDKAALEGSRLGDENEVLHAQLEVRRKAKQL